MVDNYNSRGSAGAGRVGNNAHYGGQTRQSALRSSRSPGRGSQDKRTDQLNTGQSSATQGVAAFRLTQTSGGQGQLSPLRSQVATRQGQARPGLPPAGRSDRTDLIEEEMNERRRQQELRQQIQNRERELETLSKNKDRLKSRGASRGSNNGVRAGPNEDLVNSGTIPRETYSYQRGGDRSSGYKKSSNSPLREKHAGAPTFTASRVGGGQTHEIDHKSRDRTPPVRLMPETSNRGRGFTSGFQEQVRQRSPGSPLRHKSQSRSPERVMSRERAGESMQASYVSNSTNPARINNDYLNQLFADNASLQRRLALVLQELDRINREKGNLGQKLAVFQRDNDQMQRLLAGEDDTDKINNELQVDVIGTRDNNVAVKRNITGADAARQDAIQRLKTLQAERDHRQACIESDNADYTKKVDLVRQLEQEQFSAHDQIQKMNEQLDILQRQEKVDSSQVNELQVVVDRLITERDELMDKLDSLNGTYDNCVSEITREKTSMDGHNKHHNKLLVAKIFFNKFEGMFKERKQAAMNEFFTYCKFDNKCHNTLKQFVSILERLGHYKQQIALKQWHQKTFKPIEMLVQKSQLTDDFHRKHLLSRMFNQWRQGYNARHNAFGRKNKALQKMWNIKCDDVRKDMMRAFNIWRGALTYDKAKNLKVRRLMWRMYNNKVARAFEQWVNYSQMMEQQMRLHCLAKTFAENQLKRTIFLNFRCTTAEVKRKRLNRLRSYLKAWRESRQYSKYMMGANLTSLKYRKTCNENMLKQCFDALRISKEEEKFMIMEDALTNDCMPAIETLNVDIDKREKQAVCSGRAAAVKTLDKTTKVFMKAYFRRWRDANKYVNVAIDKDLRGRIIRLMYRKVQDAFNTWRDGKNHKDVVMATMQMEMLTEEGSNLKNEVENLTKDVAINKARVDRSARSHMGKAAGILRKRLLKKGMTQWNATVKDKENKEDNADFIVNRLKKKMLRRAFALYKDGIRHARLADRNTDAAEHLRKTLEARRSATSLRNWKDFVKRHKNAKRVWKILLTKMNTWKQKQAWHKWNDFGNKSTQNEMEMTMMDMTEESNDLNGQQKELTLTVERMTNDNKKADQCLRKQGQRSLSNTFVRMFYNNQGYYFNKWKQASKFDNHRQAVLNRVLKLWKENFARGLVAMMQNWKAKAQITDNNNVIAELDQNLIDTDLIGKGNHNDHTQAAEALNERIAAEKVCLGKYSNFKEKLIADMEKRNRTMDFQSNLRNIFLTWRQYTKKQYRIANALKMVIEKSLQQKGFEHIREYSKAKDALNHKKRCIEKIRRKFWRSNCAWAIDRWRQTEFVQTKEMIMISMEQTAQYEEEHLSQVKQIKKQNGDRSLRNFERGHKAKWFGAWKNVAKWLKHKRVSTKALDEAMTSYAAKRLILKWKSRTEATIKARGAYEKFQLKRDNLYTKAVWRAMLTKFQREKALVLRLSNMAGKFDNRMKDAGFKMIKNFVASKDDLHRKAKEVGGSTLKHVFLKFYRRKLLTHFNDYRRQVFKLRVMDSKRKVAIAHWVTKDLRTAFNKWKHQAHQAQTVIDVNEQGPVVEEVLEGQLEVANLKNFMREEGFTERQINEISQRGQQIGDSLISKGVGRWSQQDGTDNCMKGKFMDRWKKFVHMRRIVKHWLDFMENRMKHVEADKSWGFNKWKYNFSDQQNGLQKWSFNALKTRATVAGKKLEDLAAITQVDEDTVLHLNDQNEELFTNYRKAKRLACALGRDNMYFGKAQAMSYLNDDRHNFKRRQLEEVLASNIELIAATKDKINELEHDNGSLATDNEELRQFSLDGYQLGKNVQSLTSEREKLSVDLADKAKTIKQLLDENERLSQKLRQATDTAQTIARNAHQNMVRV